MGYIILLVMGFPLIFCISIGLGMLVLSACAALARAAELTKQSSIQFPGGTLIATDPRTGLPILPDAEQEKSRDDTALAIDDCTPGEWRYEHGIIWATNPYGHGDMHVADPRGWVHLTGQGSCAFSPEKAAAIQDANGRLVASAPKLKAEVERLTAERDEARNKLAEANAELRLRETCAAVLSAVVEERDAARTELAAIKQAQAHISAITGIEMPTYVDIAEEMVRLQEKIARYSEALKTEYLRNDNETGMKAWLIENGYDGLYCPGDCACEIAELAPCGELQQECMPGYKEPCDCGEHRFHIGPESPKERVEQPIEPVIIRDGEHARYIPEGAKEP